MRMLLNGKVTFGSGQAINLTEATTTPPTDVEIILRRGLNLGLIGCSTTSKHQNINV